MSTSREPSAKPSTVELAPSVVDWLRRTRPMVIGGDAVDDAFTAPVENPATGRELAVVAQAGPEHVDRAVLTARKAFDDAGWRWLPATARSRLLHTAIAVIEAHTEELAQLDAVDAGIPIEYSRALVAAGIESMEYAAGLPTRLIGDALAPANLPGDRFHARVLREPLGVVALILPWNSPVAMALEKLAFVLATGNTVVLKPAEQAPLGTLRIAELLLEAGIPPGVVNVVPGLGQAAGAALVEHSGIDKISFTGSTATGKRIAAAAAANLTPVSLELGGKSPIIVCADADLEAAAGTLVEHAFYLSGQVCTAPSRVFVHRAVFDDVLTRVCSLAHGLAVGSPLDPTTAVGPLISRPQRERVLGYIDAGMSDGAELALGGAAVDGSGYFVAPTVLAHTTRDMSVEREEIFGPIVSLARFEDVAEAVERANDSSYGLAAGVWTNDLNTAERITQGLQAGNVWINCYNIFDPALPFGGYKQSGWGRENGTAAVELYTQTKTVATRTV